MASVTETKIIEQTKSLRLVCYKAYKYGNTPQGECPFDFATLKPACKNCIWFRVIDMSRKDKSLLIEHELTVEQRRQIEMKPGHLMLFDEDLK